MSRFRILSETHKVQVADNEEGLKYVFTKQNDKEISLLDKIVHSTKELDISSPRYEEAVIQDVPLEVFDFLDEKGFDTERARNRFQL